MTCLHLLRTRLRPLALVVGTAWAFTSAGCYSWHALKPTLPPPSDLVHQQVRVTLRSGQRHDLLDAGVVGDSLFGEEERPLRLRRQRWAIPVGEIANVEVWRIDAGRTALVAVGVAVVSVFAGVWSRYTLP
jgi:hypothetical protein